VYTLESLGYLARVPDSKNYRLTSRLLQFSYNYVRNNELIAKALPYLQELNRTFDETINLQELDGTEIVLGCTRRAARRCGPCRPPWRCRPA